MVFFVTLVIFFVTSIIFMNFGLSLDKFFSPTKKTQVLSAQIILNQPSVHNPITATSSAIVSHSNRQLILNKSAPSLQKNINRSGITVNTPATSTQSNTKINNQSTPKPQFLEYTPTPKLSQTYISPCIRIGHPIPCIPHISIARPQM